VSKEANPAQISLSQGGKPMRRFWVRPVDGYPAE
jgi:hypothetical protein